MKALYLKIQASVWDELDKYSKAMGISKTAIVIIALRQYFAREKKMERLEFYNEPILQD